MINSESITRIQASGFIVIPLLWLCGGLLITLPYHGGTGLNFPPNLLAWMAVAALAIWCALMPLLTKWNGDPSQKLFITGMLLWSLPLLWTPYHDWFMNALPRVAGLWGLFGLYCLLLRVRTGSRVKMAWMMILVLAAIMQALLAMMQFIHNINGVRPAGGFLQVNVLGSFLATGLVVSLWLALFCRERRSRLLAVPALVLLSATLVLIQSRASDLGAVLAIVVIFMSGGRKVRSGWQALLLMTAGLCLGLFWLYGGHLLFPDWVPAPVDKHGSNVARLYMLKLTWRLILAHPLVGNGYGSFEALFGQLASVTSPGLESATVTHPHNEVLYTWLEGGLVALAGLILMAGAVLVRLWQVGGMRFSGLALLSPLVIHSLLEYPLYLSVTHGLVLVMLLVVIGPDRPSVLLSSNWHTWVLGRLSGAITRITSICISVLVIGYMATGLISQQRLMHIERDNLAPIVSEAPATPDMLINTSALSPRLDFDRHVALLLRFNQTHNPALLESFWRWGNRFLHTHNDPKVYESLLMIARAQNRPETRDLCLRAYGRWPKNPMFVCQPDKP